MSTGFQNCYGLAAAVCLSSSSQKWSVEGPHPMPESPLNPECGGGGWVTHALTKVFFHYLFSSWVF